MTSRGATVLVRQANARAVAQQVPHAIEMPTRAGGMQRRLQRYGPCRVHVSAAAQHERCTARVASGARLQEGGGTATVDGGDTVITCG